MIASLHGSHAHTRCSTIFMLGLCMLVCFTPGCASKGERSQADAARRSGMAGVWLEQQASQELTRAQRTHDLPAPPGLPAFVIHADADADTTATATLDDALASFATSLQWPPGEPPSNLGPVSTEDRDAALKLYARGRDAAVSNRHYQAVTSLRAALERDPNAIAVMQVLARSYVALGGRDKAVDLWRRIVHLDPLHAEAMFELALAAADQRDAAISVGIFALARDRGVSFEHDPAAPMLADFALMHGLRELGYDRAAVAVGDRLVNDTGRTTRLYHARLTSLLQQLGEVQTHIGDAHSRLDDPERAMRAYAAAANSPLADPGALYPRVIYTNALLGRKYTAQFELFNAVISREPDLPVRLLVLAEYLRDLGQPTEMLVQAIREHQARTAGAQQLVRVEARLLPPRDGANRIHAALRLVDHDVDRHLWRMLAADQIVLLAQADAALALRRTAALIDAMPSEAESLALILAAAVPDPVALLDTRHARGSAHSTIITLLQARVLMSMDGYGEAWALVQALEPEDRNDSVVLRTRMEIAARLNEPQLLNELTLQAGSSDTTTMWLARARAWRTIGELSRAQHAADRAVQAAATDADAVDARIEQASNHVAMSSNTALSAEQRRQHAQDGAGILEQALEDDPEALAIAEMLASLYGPTGLLQNPDRYREIAGLVFARGRGSASFLRLAATENLNRQRLMPGLELALTLAAHDPTDAGALDMIVQCHAALDRLDDGLAWIDTQLDARPGNPALLERRVQLMVAQQQLPDAIAWLKQLRAEHPENIAVARLLEQAARQHGDEQLADALALERLSGRPDGIRRHLELAAHHAGRGDVARAVLETDAVLDRAAVAERQQLINVVGVLDRCRTEWSAGLDDDRRAQLNDALRRAADVAIRHDPTMPLQIYGMVLRDLAERDALGSPFDATVQAAIEHAPGAGRTGPRESLVWRDLAQALIDAGHNAAASRVLHVRLMTAPLPDKVASTILTRISIAVDASIEGGGDATITLLRTLHDADRAPAWNSVENPTFAQSCYEASQVYSLVGNDAGMIALLRAAIDAGSTDAMAFNNLGYYLLETVRTSADEAEAERLLTSARRAMPTDPSIADSLGHLRYLQGFLDDFINTDPSASDDELRLPGALTLLRESVDAGDAPGGLPSAEVFEHYGDALWRAGRHDEAAAAWQRGYDLLLDPERQQNILRNYELVQTRVWGIRVFDPAERHEAQSQPDRIRLLAKIEAARDGRAPAVALTFAERRARQVASDHGTSTDDGSD